MSYENIVSQAPKYALFLDDVRKPFDMIFADGIPWVIVKNYNQFIGYITKKGMPDFVTFDHDLANEHYVNDDVTTYKEKTGFDCAKWLIEYCIEKNIKLPKWRVHSMNPVGKENIICLLRNFETHQL